MTKTIDSAQSGKARFRQIRSPACGYTAVPTITPMVAVKPIARAPQNTTRMVGLKTSAPPVFAPIIPSKARKVNDPTETTGSSHVDGERSASSQPSGNYLFLARCVKSNPGKHPSNNAGDPTCP